MTPYPRPDWSPELRVAVDQEMRRQGRPLARLYFALLRRLERRYDRQNPHWDAAQYEGWHDAELVWRILFLQRAGRSLWLELRLWQEVIVTLVLFGAAAAGYMLGRLPW
jgi:hypothetical protein